MSNIRLSDVSYTMQYVTSGVTHTCYLLYQTTRCPIVLPEITDLVMQSISDQGFNLRSTRQILHCVSVYSTPQNKRQLLWTILFKIWDIVKSLFGYSSWQIAVDLMENNIFDEKKKKYPEARLRVMPEITNQAIYEINEWIKTNSKEEKLTEKEAFYLRQKGLDDLETRRKNFELSLNRTPPRQKTLEKMETIEFEDFSTTYYDGTPKAEYRDLINITPINKNNNDDSQIEKVFEEKNVDNSFELFSEEKKEEVFDAKKAFDKLLIDVN